MEETQDEDPNRKRENVAQPASNGMQRTASDRR